MGLLSRLGLTRTTTINGIETERTFGFTSLLSHKKGNENSYTSTARAASNNRENRRRPVAPAVGIAAAITAALFGAPETAGAARLTAFEKVCTDTGAPEGTPVDVTVTAIQPDSLGFVSLGVPGSDFTKTSSVNFFPGMNTANSLTQPAGAEGVICATASAGTDLALDLIGYTPDAEYVTIGERAVDTRGGNRLTAFEKVCTDTGAPEGTPVDVTVTAIQPDSLGFVSLGVPGSDFTKTSSVNFFPGMNTANSLTQPAGAEGVICATASAGTDLALDLIGYTPDAEYVTIGERAVDTRGGNRLTAFEKVCTDTGAPEGTPVDVTVTAIQPDSLGFVSLGVPGSDFTKTSSVNFFPGMNTANSLTQPAGAEGVICATASAGTDLALDLIGYTPDAEYVTIGERAVDTRNPKQVAKGEKPKISAPFVVEDSQGNRVVDPSSISGVCQSLVLTEQNESDIYYEVEIGDLDPNTNLPWDSNGETVRITFDAIGLQRELVSYDIERTADNNGEITFGYNAIAVGAVDTMSLIDFTVHRGQNLPQAERGSTAMSASIPCDVYEY